LIYVITTTHGALLFFEGNCRTVADFCYFLIYSYTQTRSCDIGKKTSSNSKRWNLKDVFLYLENTGSY